MRAWNRLIRWLEGWSRWNVLRSLGNSNLVRASVLMPAFGYMLLLNDNVHQYLTIKYDGWLLYYLHLPSVWRIWFLFYGTFFLAAATIAHSYFCHINIKHYTSPYEMADTQTQHRLHLYQRSRVLLTLEGLYDDMSEWEKSLVDLEPFDFSRRPADMEETVRQISIGLVHIWTIQSIKHPHLRIGLYITFAFGLLLIAVPAIVTFIQVTLLVVKH
jgi:hypothetical protein